MPDEQTNLSRFPSHDELADFVDGLELGPSASLLPGKDHSSFEPIYGMNLMPSGLPPEQLASALASSLNEVLSCYRSWLMALFRCKGVIKTVLANLEDSHRGGALTLDLEAMLRRRSNLNFIRDQLTKKSGDAATSIPPDGALRAVTAVADFVPEAFGDFGITASRFGSEPHLAELRDSRRAFDAARGRFVREFLADIAAELGPMRVSPNALAFGVLRATMSQAPHQIAPWVLAAETAMAKAASAHPRDKDPDGFSIDDASDTGSGEVDELSLDDPGSQSQRLMPTLRDPTVRPSARQSSLFLPGSPPRSIEDLTSERQRGHTDSSLRPGEGDIERDHRRFSPGDNATSLAQKAVRALGALTHGTEGAVASSHAGLSDSINRILSGVSLDREAFPEFEERRELCEQLNRAAGAINKAFECAKCTNEEPALLRPVKAKGGDADSSAVVFEHIDTKARKLVTHKVPPRSIRLSLVDSHSLEDDIASIEPAPSESPRQAIDGVLGGLAESLSRTQLPLATHLQRQLNKIPVDDIEFASFDEKAAFAVRLASVCAQLDVALECPTCTQPSRLRPNHNPRYSGDGYFVWEHISPEPGTAREHGSSTSVPADLKLIAAPFPRFRPRKKR